MSPKIQSDAPRILLVRLGAVGDCVHVLPALTALRHRLPRAHIGWLVEDKAASLLQGHPFLDEVIVLARSDWSRDSRRLRTFPRAAYGVFRAMADLRRRRFDVVIDFQANCRGGLWGWITGARNRISFGGHSQREANYIFTRTHVRPPAERLHKVEKNLALLRAIGIEPDRTDPVLPPLDGEGEVIGRWWSTHLGEARPIAVVHPGVSPFGFFKRWPREGYAELLGMLSDEGILSVVTWGPGEREEAEAICRTAGGTGIVGPETSSLLALADLIGRSDLFVGSDSGPLHLASAMRTPTVALFGPKDPVRYGPHGAPCRVVVAGVECSPCVRRSCSDPVCMTTLRPERVLASALDLLRETGGIPTDASD